MSKSAKMIIAAGFNHIEFDGFGATHTKGQTHE